MRLPLGPPLALTLLAASLCHQAVAQTAPVAQIQLNAADLDRLLQAFGPQQVADSHHDKCRLDGYRDIAVAGESARVRFTAHYENWQDMPAIRMELRETKVFGKTIKAHVPVAYTEHQRILSLAPTVDATLRPEVDGNRQRLALEIRDIDLGLPEPLKRLLVDEIRIRTRRVVDLPSTQEHLGVSVAVGFTEQPNSTLALDGAALTAILAKALERGYVRFAGTLVRTDKAGAFIDAAKFDLPQGKSVEFERLRITPPRLAVLGNLLRVEFETSAASMRCSRAGERPAETIVEEDAGSIEWRFDLLAEVVDGALRCRLRDDMSPVALPGPGAPYLYGVGARRIDTRARVQLQQELERLAVSPAALAIDFKINDKSLRFTPSDLEVADGKLLVRGRLERR